MPSRMPSCLTIEVMTRRNALAVVGAAAAFARPFAAAERLIKPRALKPGDTVGLITPATYVSDPDRIALAERTIRYFDLKGKMGRNVRKRSGYVGGTPEERTADLHNMFRDPDVKAIFCIRGGYGSAHLLDGIDYDL